MNAADLIQNIHHHGGEVRIEGADLVLSASQPLPADLLQGLRTHKGALLAYLNEESANSDPAETQTAQRLQITRDDNPLIADPVGPCSACGSGQWWQLPGEAWRCRRCELMRDDLSGRVTTLTLPCHEAQTRPVRDPARLRRMVELACRGLRIKPDQLWSELEASGDLAGFESDVSVKRLRKVAATLAIMRI